MGAYKEAEMQGGGGEEGREGDGREEVGNLRRGSGKGICRYYRWLSRM